MKLYENARSGNCYKVKLLLSQLGKPFEVVHVELEGDRPAPVAEGNPIGRVPTLVLDDGTHLGESNAILLYLARGSAFLPDDPIEQARVHQWMFFEQNLHEPNIAVVRRWVHIDHNADQQGDVFAVKKAGGEAALATMDRHLQRHAFFAGERYTVADISLYGYTHVAHEGGFDLGAYSAVKEWLARVKEQPGHVPM
ncbi:hypothetical protein ABI59_10940 [Acidobacteria bacterium Mor1]|nr:hypothetical protein ABI59_10940 [Acidobacteria bacterium Mor1]